MIQHYHIKGMTCNGCRQDVENKINTMEGVSAQVSLEKEIATINAPHTLGIEDIQEVLPNKYRVSHFSHLNTTDHMNSKKTTTSKWVQLQPLFLILGYVCAASILLNYSRDTWLGFLPDFMGLFFIVFSFFKFLDLKGFTISFAMYDPLAKAFKAYAWIYPFIETALGILFLTRIKVQWALYATIILLSITTIGVIKSLSSKKEIQCACLGTALNLPMTLATFIENAIMITMALLMLMS